MANDLKKTINIDDVEYNINAVYSDTAGKTTRGLVVKESGKEKFKFDGSFSPEIDYVPAKGGAFSGSVYQNNPADTPASNEFITSGQVNNRLVNLNGAPLCVWNTSASADLTKSLYSLVDGADKLYRFTTITGTESDFYLLKGVLKDASSGFTYELVNTISPALGWKTTRLTDNSSDVVVVPESYKGTYNGTTYSNPVRVIGATTFKKNVGVISILLPDGENETESLEKGIREIENYAFQGCTNLKSIVIPNSVVSTVGSTPVEGWFDGCTGLKNVILSKGEKFTSIGVKLFQNCTSLTSIVIPANVTNISANAFNGCTNLKTIYYAGTSEQWAKIEISSTGNEALKSASKVYNYTPSEATSTVGTPIDLNEVRNSPFVYICKDEEDIASPMANKIFIKLPNDDFVEIAKGATRLSSSYAAGSYTYEGLAEIIARINTRLDGLGIGINSTALAPLHSVDDVNNLVPEVKVEETFDPNEIPTIQEISGKLDTLENEIHYEVLDNQDMYITNSRIDKLETKVSDNYTTINGHSQTIENYGNALSDLQNKLAGIDNTVSEAINEAILESITDVLNTPV